MVSDKELARVMKQRDAASKDAKWYKQRFHEQLESNKRLKELLNSK